ncbi:MAG: response regulator [Leptolyngbyaceae cyanobacterium bins.349]|nr:response regulator [Leptolyngbyaceae cyanobacterium bins.349]
MTMRILLVEDDEVLSQVLTDHLTHQHYVVDTATDGALGFDFAQAVSYDLIVLDVNLPKLNGIQLCQRLRQNRSTVPILLLTAKGASSDKVMGLDAGADDYVVKPCTIEEISARIRALLRRPNLGGNPVLTWGNLCLDPGACEVTCDGHLLALSPKEYSLLELLLRNPQRTFSSSSILEHLWSFEDAPGEETIRSHIKRLRRKLKAFGNEEMIDTVYGMGYRLKALPTAPTAPTAPAATPTTLVAAEARAAAIAVWEQFKQPMFDRVALLDQALIALAADHLTDDVREAAAQAAHKLAGSLAMFGFPAGTELGRELEQLLQHPTPADTPQIQHRVAQLHQVLQQPPLTPAMEAPSLPPASFPAPSGVPVLLVTQDAAYIQSLQAASRASDIPLQVAPNWTAAQAYLAHPLPMVILLDLTLPEGNDWGFIAALPARCPAFTRVALTHQDDFDTRLASIRLGCDRVLAKATPADEVLAIVRDLLQPDVATPIRVLAVDDDPAILDRLHQCLPTWGIQLTTLTTSDNLWSMLQTTQPDLVILDVEMPAVSGIEVCQVIRSDRAWNHLPILFLTARREPDVISQIYQAGADDYVSKPFTASDIVPRIFNRLARNRLLKQQ